MVQLKLKWEFISKSPSKLYIHLPINNCNQKILSIKLSEKPNLLVRKKYFSYAKYLTKGNFFVSAKIKARIKRIDEFEEVNNSIFLKNEPSLLMNKTKKFKGLNDAREVYEWILKNIGQPKSLKVYLNDLTNEHDNLNDLKRAIGERKAMCGGKSLLFVSMCRFMGIPSRIVTGYFMRDGWTWLKNAKFHKNWLDLHVWAEFYEDGWWIPVDINIAQQTGKDYFGRFPTKTFKNKDIRVVVSRGSYFLIDGKVRDSLQTAHFDKGKNLKISLEVI
jgi:transglutaminase/protease-like cytokinesis protein 3